MGRVPGPFGVDAFALGDACAELSGRRDGDCRWFGYDGATPGPAGSGGGLCGTPFRGCGDAIPFEI